MKSDSVKYNEAVDRNFTSFERKFRENAIGAVRAIAERSLEQIKTWIGIRKNDTGYDTELNKIITAAKEKIEAQKKKAEKPEAKPEELKQVGKKPVKKDKKSAG